ncbi:multiheme c-type cytochrome [Planctomycetes bacterium K23_9]|uniref:Doubled CXXCH motif (Paired_CXXCH_1) n=1 Tax=Stieleria marina TaxID=1930275 RepID=A0A517NT55_9BACT|nr:Doubled CXXCH motif (Paired_CXXCH_1) [Planctomycetes bacterium K23_9]
MKKHRTIVLLFMSIACMIVVVNYDVLFRGEITPSDSGEMVNTVVFPVQETADTAAKGNAKDSELAENAAPTYVGRQVCGECHHENLKKHLQHGHASTFFAMEETDVPDVFDGQEFDAGEGFGTYSYKKNEAGELIATIKEDASQAPFPIQYVLGSGHNAETFLTLSTDDDGQTVGIEHRVSCYHDDRLGITVGHDKKEPANDREKYGAGVTGVPLERCVYCHTTTFKFDQGRVADLMSQVDCEKCHGPGSQHVALARQSETPPPFSVGRADWDAESEIQLCGDCHRLPRSITQQELRDYPDQLVRFQPVGMLRSKCYLESDGELRCTTCHNPHESVHGSGSKIDHVKNCIQCHDQDDSTHVICPVNATTDCIGCHMPKVDQSQGIKFHDHWIRVLDQ